MRSIVLALLASCSTAGGPVPSIPPAHVRAQATEIVERELVARHATSPFIYTETYWVAGRSLEIDGRPGESRGASYTGLRADGIPDCLLVIPISGPISTSSFVHEVTHCLLLVQYGDPDDEHRRAEWAWTVEINKALAKEGL